MVNIWLINHIYISYKWPFKNHINTCGGEFSYKPVLNARESLSLQLGHGDGDLVLDLVGQWVLFLFYIHVHLLGFMMICRKTMGQPGENGDFYGKITMLLMGKSVRTFYDTMFNSYFDITRG